MLQIDRMDDGSATAGGVTLKQKPATFVSGFVPEGLLLSSNFIRDLKGLLVWLVEPRK